MSAMAVVEATGTVLVLASGFLLWMRKGSTAIDGRTLAELELVAKIVAAVPNRIIRPMLADLQRHTVLMLDGD